MKGKDNLKSLQELEEKRAKKKCDKDYAAQKKEEVKQACVLCKEKCIYNQINILKSVCCKSSCKVDGKGL